MANRLPGPQIEDVPGDRPAPGITRSSLTDNTWSEVGRPKELANSGMDVSFPTEGGKRSLNGPNIRTR